VRGLTAADFTILEDGKPQRVKTFKAIDLDDGVDVKLAPWTRQVAPDIRRNDDLKDRRVVVIVMDSATIPARGVPHAIQFGRSVVEGLAPEDLAAVVYTLGKANGQTFTQDRTRLLAAVERFKGGFGESFYFNLMTLNTLRELAEQLASLPERRKAIFFVSAGVGLDFSQIMLSGIPGQADVAGQIGQLKEEMKAAFTAAQRANVSIYAVDPEGLKADHLKGDFLKTISESTGGFAITDINDPAPGIAQANRENGSYYLLGYQPSNEQAKGRYRKIEVKANRPDVTVRTRTGYFEPDARRAATEATRGASPSPVVSAIGGVLPKADLSLRMHAVPFARPGSNQSDVAIVLQGRHAIPEGSTAPADDVEVLVRAYDLQAKLHASESAKARIAIRPGATNDLHYAVLSQLTLKSGRYQLRLSASSTLVGKSGSVYCELDVPDFSKPTLSLSGVMLEVVPSPIAAPKGKLASIVPIVPSAERDFVTGDTVTAFARIYQGGKDALRPIEVTTRILDGAGREVFSAVETVGVARFAGERAADLRFAVPVATLAPGQHLLSVTATRGKVTTRQDVRFTMR